MLCAALLAQGAPSSSNDDTVSDDDLQVLYLRYDTKTRGTNARLANVKVSVVLRMLLVQLLYIVISSCRIVSFAGGCSH